MSNNELKPCPFCGFSAKASAQRRATKGQRESGYGDHSFGVECKADLICGAKLDGFPSQQTANSAWNYRAGGST